MANNRSALLIGVSQYEQGFLPLPGTLKDISELQDVLVAPDTGDFLNIDTMTNPSRIEMERGIEDFFSNGREDDLLLFYFSGHGDLGRDIRHQKLHLCAKDTEKVNGRLIEATAMPAEFLKRCLNSCKSNQIVIVLDCCYSGAIGELLTKGEASIDKELSGSLLGVEDIKSPGIVLLASSSSVEVSLMETDGLSLYTKNLIQGMQGAAEPQSPDWILADDLHKYASRLFEISYSAATQPKLFFTRDEAKSIPVARAPKRDPIVEYQRVVKKTFNELAEYFIEFNGDLSGHQFQVERSFLDTYYNDLRLSKEDAKQIEDAERSPYIIRAEKRNKYKTHVELICQKYEIFEKFSCFERWQLDEMRQRFSIRPEIAKEIEKLVIEDLDIPHPTDSADERSSALHLLLDLSENTQVETVKLKIQAGVFGLSSKITLIPQLYEIRGCSETICDRVDVDIVYLKQGKFLMGSNVQEKESRPTEYPQRSVEVPSFWISKTPITQRQWREVARLPKVELELNHSPSHFDFGDDYPVEQISWFEAREFCERLSSHTKRKYRLPSEVEWEYACRAGSSYPFYFGESITTDLANYDGNFVYRNGLKGKYRKHTNSVREFKPNAFGLYDMHGNVWEWCADHWHENYINASQNASPWIDLDAPFDTYRTVRGGSWDSRPFFCRSSARNGISPNEQLNVIGFRIVLDASS